MDKKKEHKRTVHQIKEEHYDRDRLKGMFLIKGKGRYLQPAAEMMCVEESNASLKINGGKLTHEETIMIAQGLGLTAREYLDIFCTGVFTKE